MATFGNVKQPKATEDPFNVSGMFSGASSNRAQTAQTSAIPQSAAGPRPVPSVTAQAHGLLARPSSGSRPSQSVASSSSSSTNPNITATSNVPGQAPISGVDSPVYNNYLAAGGGSPGAMSFQDWSRKMYLNGNQAYSGRTGGEETPTLFNTVTSPTQAGVNLVDAGVGQNMTLNNGAGLDMWGQPIQASGQHRPQSDATGGAPGFLSRPIGDAATDGVASDMARPVPGVVDTGGAVASAPDASASAASSGNAGSDAFWADHAAYQQAAGGATPVAPQPSANAPGIGPANPALGNSPGTAVAADGSPILYGVKGEETVAGNIRDIIDENSPLMKQARTAGLQQAAARGLLNSTAGIKAAQAALYQAAAPIAQADAATYHDTAARNQGIENQFSFANFETGLNEKMMRIENDLQTGRIKLEKGMDADQEVAKQQAGLWAQFIAAAGEINKSDMDVKDKEAQIAYLQEQTVGAINNVSAMYAAAGISGGGTYDATMLNLIQDITGQLDAMQQTQAPQTYSVAGHQYAAGEQLPAGWEWVFDASTGGIKPQQVEGSMVPQPQFG